MYRSRSRDRPLGGKMLIKLIITTLLLFSFNAFSCWKVEGTVAVDGEVWKIHQKVEHGKEYIFPMGTFILKITVKPGKTLTLLYVVHEKKGTGLTLVTKGEEEIKPNNQREIYAKGETGQPNSIITIKLTNI